MTPRTVCVVDGAAWEELYGSWQGVDGGWSRVGVGVGFGSVQVRVLCRGRHQGSVKNMRKLSEAFWSQSPSVALLARIGRLPWPFSQPHRITVGEHTLLYLSLIHI